MDYSGGWTPGMAPHIIDLPIWALDLKLPDRSQQLRRPLRHPGRRRCLRQPRSALALPEHDHDLDVVADQQLRLRPARRPGAEAPARHLFPRRPTAPCGPTTANTASSPRATPGTLHHAGDPRQEEGQGRARAAPLYNMRRTQARSRTIPPSPGHEIEWIECIKSRQKPSCTRITTSRGRADRAQPAVAQAAAAASSSTLSPRRSSATRKPRAAAVPKYRAPWKFPADNTLQPLDKKLRIRFFDPSAPSPGNGQGWKGLRFGSFP